MDPDIDAAAKRTISREIGDGEARRASIQRALTRLANESNDNGEKLAKAVRQAVEQAKAGLANIVTPGQINDFALSGDSL